MPAEQPKPADPRIVWSARGTWWDSIDKAGKLPSGLPCCPHCGSPLYGMVSEEEWWAGVDRYEAENYPGYRAQTEWARGQCFPSMAHLVAAYAARGDA